MDPIGKIAQFIFGESQRISLAAEDAFGGAFDALLQFLDGGLKAVMEAAGFGIKILFDGALGEIETFLGGGLARLSESLVKLAGEERLGGFGFFGDVTNAGEKIGERSAFLRELFERFLAGAFIAERAAGGLFGLIEFLGEFVVALLKIAGVLAELAHFFGELFRSVVAEFVAELLKLLLRAR